jgi:REP element-mobilizing transposase RayT
MQPFEILQFGKIYHIYNRGINRTDVFLYPEHYTKFLWLYEKYVDPVAETYAWCLLRNHFHFLLKIKKADEIVHKTKGKTISEKLVSLQFSHFFNSYSQSFNYRTKRTGGLFHTPFKRKLVDNPEYFKALVCYIHYNPVKHGFCERIPEYPWSSYGSIINVRNSLKRNGRVLGFFDGKANFISAHSDQNFTLNTSLFAMDDI